MREVGPRVTGPTGDGRAEPWSQEGGLTGIGEVGGQGTQSPGVRKADGDKRGRGTGRSRRGLFWAKGAWYTKYCGEK